MIGAMLGRNLELSRNVMCHELTEEGSILIISEIVKADARADEHALNARDLLDLAQHIGILSVIDLKIFAGLRREALTVGANAMRHLMLAGRSSEIGGRTANVMDIALEIRKLTDDLRFLQNALDAS